MLTTIRKTINGAMRKLGVLAEGEEATSGQLDDALIDINGLIENFNTQNLLISHRVDNSYPTPTGGWSNVITIGTATGSTFEEVAPIEIHSAYIRDSGLSDSPLELMSLNDWTTIITKSSVGRPTRYFISRDNQKLTIYFDVIPDADYTLHLFASLPYLGDGANNQYTPDSEIDWDYGFERMIRLNLAIELADEYQIEPTQNLMRSAQQSVDRIKAKNHTPLTSELDTALVPRDYGYFDINSGGNW
jgi:hypothetical protein